MNILFLDQFGSLGGAQRCLLDLLPLVAARGWTARVAIPEGGSLAAKIQASGVPVDSISCGPYSSTRKTLVDFGRFSLETPRLARRIASLASAHAIDLLYVNGPRLLPATAFAARRLRLPLIFHCHVHLGQPAAVRIAGWSLAVSRATMIGCCHFAAAPLRPYVNPARLHVIYNGTGDLSRPRRVPDRVIPIAIVGRIDPDKGQIDFVRAAQILKPRFPELRFLVIGAPLFSSAAYFDRVRQAAQGLPIEFQGWREDIAEVLSRTGLLIVPSFPNDPNPRVIMEAFSARVPVVAFPAGGIPEILKDGETGFLTAGHGPEALAARIAEVLSMDSGIKDAVVARARAAWEDAYTLDRFRGDVAGRIAQAASRARS